MTELSRRLLAGIWFAVMGAIPVAFYFLISDQDYRPRFSVAFTLLLFVGIPILMAGLSGFALGYTILEAKEVKSLGQAMVRGLMVSLLSYFFFFIASSLILAVSNNAEPSFIIGWTIFFFYGFLLAGWLIAIMGMVGGCLLYLYRLKRIDNRELGSNSRS
jgi:hypothetical protein